VLTGDAAHFKDNWDNDRVPSINVNADETRASRAHLAKVVADHNALLWINHDLATFDRLKHSPEYYD
jgi:N-acyl homoserine lactone hydrolase